MIKKIVIQNYRRFENLSFSPLPGMNLIVGENESGKSTLLEAIALALTGRLNGRWAQEELNPYWFNLQVVSSYFEKVGQQVRPNPPTIAIEVFLEDEDRFQRLRGVNNSLLEDSPGLRVLVEPDPDFAIEFEEYLRSTDRPAILPTEYYKVKWMDFSGESHRKRFDGLGVAFIDSKTLRSTSGIDYQTRQMLIENVSEKEGAAISIAYRRARHKITAETLDQVNARIKDSSPLTGGIVIGLQIDQSSTAGWEGTIVPQVDSLPFAMAGQGQQVTIKIALALQRSSASSSFVLIEEPENHLSHTSLTQVVWQIEQLSKGRQAFVTTHSSFVLNRLGLDSLHLLSEAGITRITDLTQSTVEYFRLQSGYDTLRMVLARRLALVEGPSDEMIFNRAYRDQCGKLPIEDGIDVISQGTRTRRGLELCSKLQRRVAILRDNDARNPEHWKGLADEFLEPGTREIFIGSQEGGRTLEPQIIHVNDATTLREVVNCPDSKDLAEFMEANKTDVAWAIAISSTPITYPKYILDAVEFIKP